MKFFEGIKKWFTDNRHKCSRCGSHDTDRGHKWIRGWNNLCNQAYGDWGWYCRGCGKIDFETSLEEHKKSLPAWCEPYEMRESRADSLWLE